MAQRTQTQGNISEKYLSVLESLTSFKLHQMQAKSQWVGLDASSSILLLLFKNSDTLWGRRDDPQEYPRGPATAATHPGFESHLCFSMPFKASLPTNT